MNRYRYEVHATAFGICEAENPKDAELKAVCDAVDRIYDNSPTVTYDTELTLLPSEATQE